MDFQPEVSTPEDVFPFTQLSSERNEIRILALLPGSWADDIRCTLTTASLDDDPLYHSLSYAWGHHSTQSSLCIDGHTVHITPSLESALRQIRQHDEVLHLWVDKLCINQSDEKEKSRQVAMMHRVFRQCSNALIWLGHAEPTSELAERHEILRRWSHRSVWSEEHQNLWTGLSQALSACCSCFGERNKHRYGKLPPTDDDDQADSFKLVLYFAEDRHISDLPCFQRKGRSGKLVFRETPQFRTMWLHLRQLLETSWHSRFWTVQEALLPKNAWVLYGNSRIPFSTIMSSLRNHRRHLFTCCSQAEKLFTGSMYAFCPDSLYLTPPATWDFDALLRTYRYKDCRDPRDKVYGIHSLLENTADVQVDYTLSINDVYTNAMKLIIESSNGDLRCFTGAGFGDNSYGMPSWVRDLAETPNIAAVQMENRRLEAYSLYNAAGGYHGKSLELSDYSLHISGVLADTINHVCSPMDAPIEQLDYKHSVQTLLSWRRAANLAGDRTSLLRPNVHNQAFWRTILSDLVWVPEQSTFRRFTSEDVKGYQHWLRQSLQSWITLRKPALLDAYVQALISATYGRCLFVTTSGNLGLCYPNTRPGDEVWVLKGGRVPMVLRSKSTTETSSSMHGLVSDCYLHGYMDGEALGTQAYQPSRVVLV